MNASPSGAIGSKWLTIFAFSAVLVALGYTFITGHIWEDYFITFRHSANLCEGRGLVYNEGERVQGFTSPLGVLLPAFGYWITGMGSYLPALWVFRIVSIGAFAAGGVCLLWRVRHEQAPSPLPALFLALFYLVEAKSVAFATNGMETGFVLFFLAAAMALFRRAGPERWIGRGLCWAGLMWTRPDGWVAIAALGLAELAFYIRPRRAALPGLAKSAALCAVLYLPWFIGAWIYYGSPVPNTIAAKANPDNRTYADFAGEQVLNFVPNLYHRAAEAFAPIYSSSAPDWPQLVTVFCGSLGVFCLLYWLVPVNDRFGRAASLCFALLTFYKVFIPLVYPWYHPPAAMFGIVALSQGVWAIQEALRARLPLVRTAAVLILSSAGVGMAVLFGMTISQIRVQQKVIEGQRTRIGLWLAEQIRPGDRVYLEPLGYIGYFSGAHIIDFPGLVSPEVVKLRKTKQLTLYTLVPRLAPEWVVLRPGEADWMFRTVPYFREQYEQAKVFDARPELRRERYEIGTPGSLYLWYDSVFLVYKRKQRAEAPGG